MHRDTKTEENVHLPHMHQLAHDPHSQNIRLIRGDASLKLMDALKSDSMAVVADSSLNTSENK